jgi:1,2-diacylglycerol 3-alpha-glucosyltransferase
MKIAIFTETFFPHTNGVLTAIINLSKGLADNGHQVYIITPKFKGGQEFIYPNITVHYIKGINAFIYEDIKLVSPVSIRTLNFLKKEKIDIIHFMSPWTTGNKAIFISKFLKVPLVGTFHTLIGDPENLKHVHLNYPFVKKHVWKYINSYYDKCDLVTCPSNFAKQELIKNKCKAPIKVISNGIEKQDIDKKALSKLKRKYKKTQILLFVGRIAYEKNIEQLIDCFKLILKEKPKVKLLLIGGGPQEDIIKTKIKQYDLEKNIIMLGPIEHKKLLTDGYYQLADLFVSTSKTETFGLTMLEAQINGVVCVVSNAAGVGYLIKNNKTGILVPPDNNKAFAKTVIKMLSDKKKCAEIKKNLKESVKIHYIPNIIEQWEKEYSRLIKKNRN